ncbi:hypothetical protein Tco_0033512 [Tanacetum coccineum]
MDGRWSRYGVRTGKFMDMVVVHGGEHGGEWRIKGVFGSLDPRILTTPSSSPNALMNMSRSIQLELFLRLSFKSSCILPFPSTTHI